MLSQAKSSSCATAWATKQSTVAGMTRAHPAALTGSDWTIFCCCLILLLHYSWFVQIKFIVASSDTFSCRTTADRATADRVITDHLPQSLSVYLSFSCVLVSIVPYLGLLLLFWERLCAKKLLETVFPALMKREMIDWFWDSVIFAATEIQPIIFCRENRPTHFQPLCCVPRHLQGISCTWEMMLARVVKHRAAFLKDPRSNPVQCSFESSERQSNFEF